MEPSHTHDGDGLHFGCPGCISVAERARVTNAPVRRVTWHCNYEVPHCDERQTLTFTRDVKVPDGWTGDQIDIEYMGLVGEAFVLSLPDTVDMDETDYAMETMEVVKVVIGDLATAPALAVDQPELFA